MYTAFLCSDYYDSSVPLWQHQPATCFPVDPKAGRDRYSGSHVHFPTVYRVR